MTAQTEPRNSETEFQYSDAVKGAEAICAQLRVKLTALERTEEEGLTPHDQVVGFRAALFQAVHATGMMRYTEKREAGAFRTPRQEAERDALMERHRIERIHNGEADAEG